MPKITKTEVKKMAQLARLKLSDKEIEAATKDLSSILEHFSTIQSIDTTGVPTSDDVSGLSNIARSDTPDQGNIASIEDTLKAAPDTKDGQLKVTSVF